MAAWQRSSLQSSSRSGFFSKRTRQSAQTSSQQRPVVRAQRLDVRRAAGLVADRVELEREVGEAQLAVERRQQVDHLGVDERVGVADRLDAELRVLAVAARLRAVVAEVRADVEEPHRLRQARHAVLDVRPHDARRALRPQREHVVAAVLEEVDLLVDDVGALAGRPQEDAGVLEDRASRCAGSRTARTRARPCRGRTASTASPRAGCRRCRAARRISGASLRLS